MIVTCYYYSTREPRKQSHKSKKACQAPSQLASHVSPWHIRNQRSQREVTNWKSKCKHILKMKANFENESIFWKWKQILKMKAHFENKSTLWKWKHILKMQVHFVSVKTEGKCPWSDYWIDNRASAWNLIISWFILLCMPYYYILHTILVFILHRLLWRWFS